MNNFYEIKPRDVGLASIECFGHTWLSQDWIGRILPRDVGKRVYLRNGVLQVESDEQMATRKERRP